MPRSHLHEGDFRERAGHTSRNSHIDPVAATRWSRPTQFREHCLSGSHAYGTGFYMKV